MHKTYSETRAVTIQVEAVSPFSAVGYLHMVIYTLIQIDTIVHRVILSVLIKCVTCATAWCILNTECITASVLM